MKTVCALIVISVAFVVAAPAEEAPSASDSFTRTVHGLESPRAKTIEKTGADNITIRCTILPEKKFVALAWEIENPHKKVLDVNVSNIKVRDQVEPFRPLKTEAVANILYGTAVPEARIQSPGVDAWTPQSSLIPRLQERSMGEEDIYSSDLDFGKTDSKTIRGLTYYDYYGSGEKVSAEMTLNNERFDFEF